MLNRFIQLPSTRILNYTIALSLCLTLPNAINNSTWAQTSRNNINPLIEQLKSPNQPQWNQAIEALSQRKAEAIPALRKALKHPHPRVRSGAAFALGKIGTVAASAIPDLGLALKDQDKNVRGNVVFALGNMGKATKTVVPQLAAALKNKNNASIRISIIRIFESLGKDARVAVPQLLEILNDPDGTVRYNAIQALIKIGATPEIIVATKNPDPLIRAGAIASLGQSSSPEAIKAVMEGLKDKNKQVRLGSIYTLAALGTKAKSTVPELIIALKDTEEDIRQGAAEALGQIRPLKEMVAALQDSDENVQSGAAYALGKIGAAAVPDLRIALKHPNPRVRSNAASALGDMGKPAAPAIVELKELLQDEDAKVRQQVIRAVEFSGEAKTLIPQLIPLLKDKNDEVRIAAASSLNMGTIAKAAIPALVNALQDPNRDVRNFALSALSGMKEEAKSLSPRVIAMLQDEDALIRMGVVSALINIHGNKSTVVPHLGNALKSPDKNVRVAAAYALGDINNPTQEAIKYLIETGDPDAEVRDAIAVSLFKFSTKIPNVIPQLSTALNNQNKFVRQTAVIALAQIRLPAKSAIPQLISTLKDPDKQVQISAAQALGIMASSFQERAKKLSPSERNAAISLMQQSLNALEKAKNKSFQEPILIVKQSIQVLKKTQK